MKFYVGFIISNLQNSQANKNMNKTHLDQRRKWQRQWMQLCSSEVLLGVELVAMGSSCSFMFYTPFNNPTAMGFCREALPLFVTAES